MAVLLPEGIVATAVAVVVPLVVPLVGPLVGPLVNLPTDAAIDWVLLGLAAYALLGIFPAAVVREHHVGLFHPTR